MTGRFRQPRDYRDGYGEGAGRPAGVITTELRTGSLHSSTGIRLARLSHGIRAWRAATREDDELARKPNRLGYVNSDVSGHWGPS